MNAHASTPQRRFYRVSDRAWLGGVCAGLADYFGFNLKVTRVLAVVALFMATPMAIVAYLAVVVLVPTAPASEAAARRVDPEIRRAVRSSPSQTMADVRGRFKALNRRLARLEKYVTSSRYELDREFERLQD